MGKNSFGEVEKKAGLIQGAVRWFKTYFVPRYKALPVGWKIVFVFFAGLYWIWPVDFFPSFIPADDALITILLLEIIGELTGSFRNLTSDDSSGS